MTLEEIEEAVINRLKTTIPDLEITGFPERPDEYQFLHPKGAVLVRYQGSRFTEPPAIRTVSQIQTLEFQIVLIARGLRTHKGAYAYLDQIRASLTGFQIQGLGKFYPVREQFIEQRSGLWFYAVLFVCQKRHEEV